MLTLSPAPIPYGQRHLFQLKQHQLGPAPFEALAVGARVVDKHERPLQLRRAVGQVGKVGGGHLSVH
jgi:hypothetical protein